MAGIVVNYFGVEVGAFGVDAGVFKVEQSIGKQILLSFLPQVHWKKCNSEQNR